MITKEARLGFSWPLVIMQVVEVPHNIDVVIAGNHIAVLAWYPHVTRQSVHIVEMMMIINAKWLPLIHSW